MRFYSISLAFLLSACSNSDFRGGRGFGQNDVTVKGNNVVQTIPLNSSSRKVDLVWLIDNSGSMSEEAELVRSNFSSFINTLGNATDLKLALISNTSSSNSSRNTGVTLPVSGSNFLQIPAFVDSTDALALAALATCPSNSAPLICGQNIDVFSDNFDPDYLTVDISGKLSNFFRPDAHRVYVIVTDDDAYDVDSSNFLQLVTPYSNNRRPTVFAFIGKASRSGCQISRRGAHYESLATTTGGETFDICEANWQPYFSKLTSSVELIASKEFILNDIPAKIVSVKLDGQLLNSSQYSLIGGKLRLSENIVSPQNKQIVVEYVKSTT